MDDLFPHLASLLRCCRAKAVDITISYELDDRVAVRVPIKERFFLLFTPSIPAAGPSQPPIELIPVILSPDVKLPGREADH
jgi:hypothetical protein